MRILFLCTYYHNALLYKQQRDGLTERGHKVVVFNSAEIGTVVEEKYREAVAGSDVFHRPCWNKWDRLFFFPRQRKIEKELEKAVDLRQFDLMHAHLLVSSGYTARKMKRRYGLKYIVSVRGTDLAGFIRLPFFRGLALKNAEEASGMVFLSRAHKAEYFGRFVPKDRRGALERKSIILGNPLERFWEKNTAAGREGLLEKGKLRILLVGKIERLKNIPAAIEAVKILRQRGHEATLTVVGEVVEEEELSNISGYEYVKILPFMGPDGLLEIYRTHDIFLLPSKRETFGRVYIEAMSQGLPVLYTKGQGFDQAYPDGVVGYPIPGDAPDVIADRIEDVMDNYSEISNNCVECIKDFYEDRIIDKLESFYKNCLK